MFDQVPVPTANITLGSGIAGIPAPPNTSSTCTTGVGSVVNSYTAHGAGIPLVTPYSPVTNASLVPVLQSITLLNSKSVMAATIGTLDPKIVPTGIFNRGTLRPPVPVVVTSIF